MKRIFSMFQQEIKFDCLVLAIFQSFYRFVIYIFDKLAPLPLANKLTVLHEALHEKNEDHFVIKHITVVMNTFIR